MKLRLFVLLGLACSLLASPALANITGTATYVDFVDAESGVYYNLTPGALEFNLSAFTFGPGEVPPAPGQIFTFCVEINEPISEGTTYDAVVNWVSAVQGGVGSGPAYPGDATGSGGSDPISEATAWVYREYLHNKQYEAKEYQMAIWVLEDELDISSPVVFLTLLR